jgi:putative oxidoreductase
MMTADQTPNVIVPAPARLDLPLLAFRWFLWGSNQLQSFALLVVRLAWGWESYESGYGHLTHVKDTAAFFQSLGIPHPVLNVYISGYTEMIGGVLLMLGLGSRFISLPLIFNFIIAIVTASRDHVVKFFSEDPSNIVDDTAFPFLVTALIVLAFGPGWFSVDGILRFFVFKRLGWDRPARQGM